MSNFLYKYLAYLIFPVTAAVLSWVLTLLCIKLMPAIGLVAIPGGRHIHSKPTPKGGGIAVAIAFFVVWYLLLRSPWSYFIGILDKKLIWLVALHSIAIILTGMLDDRFGIPAIVKLLAQCAVSASCWHFGIKFQSIFGYELGTLPSLLLTVFWIVSFINAFNLIDGMDGLASGLAIISSLCMASYFALQHNPLDTVAILCLGAANLGFLRYNFYPAKIFLGDTGSMFLGFMFAIVGIISSAQAATLSSVLIPLLAAGIPFFDVFFAIWRRFTKKLLFKVKNGNASSGVMSADSDHIHHRLLQKHKNQRKAVLSIYSIATALASVSILLQLLKNRAQGLALLLFLLIAVTIIRRLATFEIWNSTQLLIKGLEKPRAGVLVSIFHPFYDLSVILFSTYMSCFLFSEHSLAHTLSKGYVKILYLSAPIVIILHVAKTYSRVWHRACSRDYLRLLETIFLGHIVSTSINWSIHQSSHNKTFWSFHLLFLFVSASFIIGERIFIRYIRTSILRKSFFISRFRPANMPRILIYGGGLRCLFYLTRIYNNFERNPVDIVGIIDDNPALMGQIVYGYEVIGNFENIEAVIKENKIDRLVLALEIKDQEKKTKISKLCKENGINVSFFELTEKTLN